MVAILWRLNQNTVLRSMRLFLTLTFNRALPLLRTTVAGTFENGDKTRVSCFSIQLQYLTNNKSNLRKVMCASFITSIILFPWSGLIQAHQPRGLIAHTPVLTHLM